MYPHVLSRTDWAPRRPQCPGSLLTWRTRSWAAARPSGPGATAWRWRTVRGRPSPRAASRGPGSASTRATSSSHPASTRYGLAKQMFALTSYSGQSGGLLSGRRRTLEQVMGWENIARYKHQSSLDPETKNSFFQG